MLVDHNSILQFINQAIVEEILLGKKLGCSRTRWSLRVLNNLREIGITHSPRGAQLTQQYLLSHKYKLLRGQVDLALPTVLRGRSGLRTEKDRVYTTTWSHIEMYLQPPLKYCGLAATNIGVIAKRVDLLTCCEKDTKTAILLHNLKNIFLLDSLAQISIKQVDILDYLTKTTDKYNILDLDLMAHLNTSRVVRALENSTDNTSIVALTTSIGRNTTWKTYEKKRQELKNMLEESFGKVLIAGGKYLERKIPMAYEHIVLVK